MIGIIFYPCEKFDNYHIRNECFWGDDRKYVIN